MTFTLRLESVPQVLIIGAGLAGLSAASHLQQLGHTVHIIEANPFVGGRTASWDDHGLPVETGLHRFLGFYKELPELLERSGLRLDEVLHWEDEVEIRAVDGARAVMGAAPLRKPVKTAAALLGHNDFLEPSDKLALGAFFADGLARYAADPAALDQLSVADLARHHHLSDRALLRLITPLTEGIFFTPPEQYSAYALFGLIGPYLPRLPLLRVGAFTGGMTAVMAAPIAHAIKRRGGGVTPGLPAEALIVKSGRVIGVRAHGRELTAEHVILATGVKPAQDLLAAAFPEASWLGSFQRLQTVPVVTFQLELSRPALPQDRTTFGPGTCLASFSEQSRTTFPGSRGRLSIILSPPQRFQDLAPEAILDLVLADARKLGIHLADSVLDYRKVHLPHDFYALAPGQDALRPPQATPVPGLTLAGDYTRQPYLATMEGAVVSGRLAAAIAAEQL